jgi:hypothetical protein
MKFHAFLTVTPNARVVGLGLHYLVTENRYWLKRISLKCYFRREKITDIDPRYLLVPRDAAMDILPIIHTGFSSRLGMLYHIYGIRTSTF